MKAAASSYIQLPVGISSGSGYEAVLSHNSALDFNISVTPNKIVAITAPSPAKMNLVRFK